MPEPQTCKNCGQPVSAGFCPACGQKVIEQISWRYLFLSVLDSLEFKKGVLFNLKQFTVAPSSTLNNYLNGSTKNYLGPVSYSLLGLTLLFLSIQVMASKLDDKIYGQAETLAYAMTAIFPLFFSAMLFGASITGKPNFLKSLIASLFLTGHILICFVLLKAVLFGIDKVIPLPKSTGIILFLIILVYFSISFSKAYLRKSIFQTLVRLTASWIVVFLVSFFLLGIALTVLEKEMFAISSASDFGYQVGRTMYVISSFK